MTSSAAMVQTSPGVLLPRIEIGNRSARINSIESALLIAEFGHTRLGDTIQAFTDLRYIKERLDIRHVDVNLPDPAEYRLSGALLEGNPLVRRCTNLPYAELPYWEYQAVLHYCVFKDSALVPVLAENYDRFVAASSEGIAFYSVRAHTWDLKRIHSDWREFAYPLPMFPLPSKLLDHAIGDHRIYLHADELSRAEQWLAQAGIKHDDRLIVLIDDASTREKVLHPRCCAQILEHFLSMENVKALVYDVRGEGKQELYRESLGAELCSRIVFSTRNGLRRDLALLASPSVKMIFGPDTGMMHCAAGVYAARAVERLGRQASTPLILVYVGRWSVECNLWKFWSNSLAQCVVFYETGAGKALKLMSECPRESAEFNAGLGYLDNLPADMMLDCLQSKFSAEMQLAGLLKASPGLMALGLI